MSKKNQFKHNNIIYFLDHLENKAYVKKYLGNNQPIIIPRSITFNSKEYLVTRILDNAFEDSAIKSIQFDPDSKLQIIGTRSFYRSSIQSITIPSEVTTIEDQCFYSCEKLQRVEIPTDSKLQTIGQYSFCATSIQNFTIPSKLIKLGYGWCNFTCELEKIFVSPDNPRFRVFDEKFILGKTKIEQNDYDCLIFCSRKAKQVTIPNFIEYICPFAFNGCSSNIEFQEDSKLHTIQQFAFFASTIDTIKIPSEVKIIEKEAFRCNIKTALFQKDSKLQVIDEMSFYESTIESIKIPQEVKSIGNYAFSGCKQLQKIEFDENSKLQTIGKRAIYDTSIKSITIPSELKLIDEESLASNIKLNKIWIPADSKLQTIEKFGIHGASITSLIIPVQITSIGTHAFSYCRDLQIIEISYPEMKDMFMNNVHLNPKFIIMCPVNKQ